MGSRGLEPRKAEDTLDQAAPQGRPFVSTALCLIEGRGTHGDPEGAASGGVAGTGTRRTWAALPALSPGGAPFLDTGRRTRRGPCRGSWLRAGGSEGSVRPGAQPPAPLLRLFPPRLAARPPGLLTLAAGSQGLELSHHKFPSSRNPAWERKETRREYLINIFPT